VIWLTGGNEVLAAAALSGNILANLLIDYFDEAAALWLRGGRCDHGDF